MIQRSSSSCGFSSLSSLSSSSSSSLLYSCARSPPSTHLFAHVSCDCLPLSTRSVSLIGRPSRRGPARQLNARAVAMLPRALELLRPPPRRTTAGPAHLNSDHGSHRIRVHVYTHASRMRDTKCIKHPRARPRPISDNGTNRSDARTRFPMRLVASLMNEVAIFPRASFDIIMMTTASWDSFISPTRWWTIARRMNDYIPRAFRRSPFQIPSGYPLFPLSRVVQTDSERRMCDGFDQQRESFPRQINRLYLFIYLLPTQDRFTSYCCIKLRGVIHRDDFAR